MGKENCWEFKGCGRQPGGDKAEEFGICPAAVETRVDGVNRGEKGGRACWAITGTFCGGKVQGTFAAKFENCETCDFYAVVRQEEFPNFQYSSTLLAKLRR